MNTYDSHNVAFCKALSGITQLATGDMLLLHMESEPL